MVYAIWIKDGYEQLGQESCKTRESEPGQVLNDRHIPRLEPCEIQVSQVFHSILQHFVLISPRKDIVKFFLIHLYNCNF